MDHIYFCNVRKIARKFAKRPAVPATRTAGIGFPQKGIKYNHEDWGKPINYYNNLNNFQNSVRLDAQVQVKDPVPDPVQMTTAYISPQAQEKINAVSQSYNLCSEEKYMLQFMFNRSISQVNSNQYKPSELEWVQNTILMELVNEIRGLHQKWNIL